MIDYNLIRRPSVEEVVPEKLLNRMAIKIYMVGSLVWDYADTVLDLVRQARISETKKHSRELQAVRERYLRFREKHGGDSMAEEARLGLMFEQLNQKRMDRLYKHLCVEIRYTTQLNEQWRTICASVLTALTVLDAIKLYARECDRRIAAYGALRGHSILQDEFEQLGRVLHKFVEGRCYSGLVTRRQVAQELYAEILSLETTED